MASVNKAILIGNLGRDPELKYTQSGQAVTNFSIATNERWKDKNGETQERTEWHRIVVWGKTAENCVQYLEKGRSVYVEGRLQTREYEDKDGIKRNTTEIVANQVTFLGGRGGVGGAGGGGGSPGPSAGEGGAGGGGGSPGPSAGGGAAFGGSSAAGEDDIPF